MQVFLENSVFEGNTMSLSPIIFQQCDGTNVLQLEKMFVSSCTFSHNSGEKAGVLYVDGAGVSLMVRNSIFYGNTGGSAGSIHIEGSQSSTQITVISSKFHKNTGDKAGAVSVVGTDSSLLLNVTDCEFYMNTGSGWSSTGCIFLKGFDSSMNMSISNSKFHENTGKYGSVDIIGESDSVTLISVTSSEFCRNRGMYTGSVHIRQAGSFLGVDVISSEFVKNTGSADSSTGSILIYTYYVWGTSTVLFNINSSKFHKNTGDGSGSIYIIGLDLSFVLQISNSTFLQNIGQSEHSAGSVFVQGSTITAVMNVTDSEFFANTAGSPVPNSGDGAGVIFMEVINSSLDISVISSIFSGNIGFAWFSAGCIYISTDQVTSTMLSLVQTQFHDNRADGPYSSAGSIYINAGDDAHTDVSVTSTEFHNNTGGTAGSVFIEAKQTSSQLISLRNSKFCKNTAGSAFDSVGSVYIKGLPGSFLNVSIKTNTFQENTGIISGSIYIAGYSSSLDIRVSGSEFDENKGNTMGSVYIKAQDKSALNFNMTDSYFHNNTGQIGGALSVEGQCSSVLQISKSQFVGNVATHSGSAINIEYDCIKNETSMKVSLSNTDFIHNIVPEETFDQGGGALLFSAVQPQSRTQFYIAQCKWENNTSSTHGGALAFHCFESSIIHIVRSYFLNNRAAGVTSQGGACYFQIQNIGMSSQKGKIQIDECIFDNNVATEGGSSVFQTSQLVFDIELEIQDTTFVCCNDMAADFIYIVIFSKLKNTQFLYMYQKDEIFMTGVSLKAKGPYLLDNLLLSCYKTDVILSINSVMISKNNNVQLSQNYSNDPLSSLSAYCGKCDAKPFAAGDGSLHIYSQEYKESATNTLHLFQHYFLLNSACQPCPFGGHCSNGKIKALPNYWGHQHGGGQLMSFLPCPPQYCCNGIDVPCDSFDACAPHRVGQMCGKCQKHFSESLMSTVCMADEMCDDWWVWLLGVVLAFSYLMWYMYRGNIFNICKRIIPKHKICSTGHATFAQDNSCEHNNAENAFFDILVYFSNIISLLKVQVQFQNSKRQAGLLYDVDKYFMRYLDVDVQQILHKDVCPLPGIDMAMKTLSRPLFTVLVFLVWCFLFSGTKLLIRVFAQKVYWTQTIFMHFKHKLIEGFVETAKYSYSGFAGATFILLTCINIGDKSFWKYDAEVDCYSTLQKSVMVFAALYTIPFVLISLIAGKLLRAGTLGHIQVMFACIFPLPLIAYWSFKQLLPPKVCKQQTEEKHIQTTGQEQTMELELFL